MPTPDDDKTQAVTVLSKGTVINHYRIIEKIGAGGMGEVFLAEDTELNRKVALKFLSSHLCQNADCRTRFKREAQAAAKLDHPNIVTVHEVGEFKGRPFFAMQHIEGRSLREYASHQELSIPQVLEIGIQIAEGLQAAHEKGVTHRDIKPANVLIDSHGRARILDFGLASVAGTDHLTKTGSTLGTIGYMSPEQVRGEEIDQRSDIFSLCVVLYELITSRQPFKGDNEVATVHNITDHEPEPLARYKTAVSAELQRIISKALAKDKRLRYQHADELAADLKSLMGTSQILTVTPIQKNRSRRLLVGVAALVFFAVAAVTIFESRIFRGGKPSERKKMLVVLPFQNLGSANDEYFADGITDEITSRLGVIEGLGVISRTSAVQYKNTNKGLPQIAKELAVDYVLEGTIRWDKSGDTDLVRITPQLIKASDNTHIWAGNYERPLKSVFAVQVEIATRIADTLGLTLLEPARQALAAKPTNSLEAYNFYLRGREYWENKQTTEHAIQMLEKAVELDSNFYQAYYMLARLCGITYINDRPGDKELSRQAKAAAERAFQLASGQPEGYLAMGYYYYYFSRDYDRAVELFHKALEGQPSNCDLLMAIAFVERRQGKWEEAADNLRKAFRLDPGSIGLAHDLAQTLLYMHRPNDAETVIDRAMELSPNNQILLLWKTMLPLLRGRDTSEVRAALRKTDQYAERPIFAYWAEIVDIWLRDYKTALTRRDSPGGYDDADSTDFYLSRASIYGFLDETDSSRAYYDLARIACERAVGANPDVASKHMALAQAYAGLGRKQDAIREGKKAAELLPIAKDALSGTDILQGLAEVYTTVGEYDLAIDELEYLLSIPSGVHVENLRRHPIWDHLRHLPRFQKLLEKYGT